MTGFDVAGAARAAGGRLEGLGRTASVRRVVIDSREVEEGDLFVALPGTRTDGHGFVAEALRRGAVGALVGPEAPPLEGDLAGRSQIRVADPRRALSELAAAHRRTLRCPVIAITGSNGKSSTREMVARALSPLGEIVQSQKSYNNDLGVPLTVLRAGPATAALVVEMGTSGPGEIARLCDVARPDVGVVTNVSAAHLEGLGTEEGVAHEKAALVRCLPPEGRAVLNGDDPRVAAMAGQTTAPALRFSVGDPRAEVWGCEPRRTPRGVEFFLYGKMRIFLPVPGLHNVPNALAAVAVGLLQGIEPGALREALRGVRLPSMRMQRIALGGRTLLLDCYNANPASLHAAVEELSARPARGRRVLVMGDMRELGPRSADLHYAAGRHAASRVDFLWCVGPESRHAYEAARDEGLEDDRLAWSPTVEDAAAVPAVRLARGDVALLKASRGMRLERLADVLRRGAAERPELVGAAAGAAAGEDAALDARRVG